MDNDIKHSRTKHRFGRWLALSVLSAILTYFVIQFVWEGDGLNASAISGACFLFVGLAVAFSALWMRRPLLDNPFYVAFFTYVFFLGVAPLLVGFLNPLSKVVRTDAYIEPAPWIIGLSWAGLLMLTLGYRLGSRRRKRGGQKRLKVEYESRSTLLLWGGLGWTLIGAAGAVSYLLSVGGLSYLLQTVYGTRENASVYAGLYNMLRPGLFLLTAWAFVSNAGSRILWFLLLAYACFDLFWFGPLSGSRSQIITLMLTLFYIARYTRGRPISLVAGVSGRRWLIVVGVALVLVWGALRGSSIEDLASGDSAQIELVAGIEGAFAETLYVPYQGFESVLQMTPRQIPYQWGGTLFDSLTVFIPRALWPSKPGSLGDWLATTIYGTDTGFNTVATWAGELYLNFGWLGLVFGMYGTGLVCAKLAQLRTDDVRNMNTRQALLAAVWFPLPLVWIWGGSNAAIWHVLFNVVPIWLVFKLYEPVPSQSARLQIRVPEIAS